MASADLDVFLVFHYQAGAIFRIAAVQVSFTSKLSRRKAARMSAGFSVRIIELQLSIVSCHC